MHWAISYATSGGPPEQIVYLVQQGAIQHTAHGGRGEPTPVSVDRKASVSSKEGHARE